MKYLLFLLLIATSCAPVYVPNLRNSPMFAKGGEFQGAIQIGNGLDAQAAVSVTNHIGVMGNFSYANRHTLEQDQDDDYHRHKLMEAGIGYFQNDEKTFFEIFAGYGEGEGSSYSDYDFFGSQTERATGKFQRYFIQPAFGFNKKMMHVSFVPRVSVVDFNSFSSDVSGSVITIDEDPKVFIEPAVIGRLNLADNHFFFTFQAGVSFAAGNNVYFDHRPFQFGTGFGFRLGGVKKVLSSETK